MQRIERRATTTIDVDTTAAVVQVAALDQLISNLSADVGLNVDTEDAARQLAALDTAIPDITTTIDADVNINEAQALTEIERLRRLLEDITANVRIDVDEQSATAAVTEIRGLVGDLEATIEVNADSGPAIAEITALEAAVGRLRETVEIEVDLDGLRDALAEIAGVEAALTAVAAEDLNLEIDVDVEGVSSAIGELATLEAAAEALDRRIVITVAPGETAGTIAELGEIQGLAEYVDGFSDLSLAVDLIGAESTIAQLTTIAGLVTEIERRTVNIRLDLDGASSTLSGLAAVEGATRTIDGTYLIDIRALAGDALVTLGQLNAGFQAIPERVDTVMEIDGVLIGLQQLGFLNAAFDAIPERVETTADFDAAKALAEAAIYRGELATLIPENIDTRVGVDRTIGSRVGGFARIGGLLTGFARNIQSLFSGFTGLTQASSGVQSSLASTASAAQGITKQTTEAAEGVSGLSSAFSGLASAGGKGSKALTSLTGGLQKIASLLLKFNLIGGVIATIVGAVAYLIPLATGLIGAAAGFLAFAAGATVAAGAVGALVFLLDDTVDIFKSLFTGFKAQIEGLRPVLEPIRDLLVNSLGIAINSLAEAVQKLAPIFETAFGPLIDAILPIIDVMGELSGPVAVAVGAGLTELTNIIRALFEAVDVSRVIANVEAFFFALNSLVELLGQTGLAFPLVDLLTSLGEIFQNAIDPFIQIIADFSANFDSIGAGITALLEPIGEFARVFGLAFAAVAPQLSNLFELITGFIPLINFDVLSELAETIVPQLVSTLEALAPQIQQLTEGWVELVASLSEGDRQLLIPTLIASMLTFGQIVQFTTQLALALWDAFVGGMRLAVQGLGRVIQFVGFLGELAALVFSGITTVASNFVKTLAVVTDAVASLPGIENLLPGIGGIGDQVRDAANQIRTLGDTTVSVARGVKDFGRNLAENVDIAFDFARGVLSGGQALDTFAGKAARAELTLRSLSAAQRVAGQVSSALSQAYGPINALAEQATSGDLPGIADFIQSDAEATAQAAKRYGGGLADYFRAETEEAAKAQSTGISVLSYGSISDYMDRENLDIDRAIHSLETRLRTQAENIGKLNFIASLGFGPLAEQLATLRDNPEMLAKAIEDLSAGGIGAFREANGRIASAQMSVAAQMAQLNPALEEVFGVTRDTVENEVDKTSTSVTEAFGNFAAEQTQHAENIRRIGQLYSQGFTFLAEELYSLEGDPAALQAAMSQLEGASTASLQSLEASARQGIASVQSAYESLPESLQIKLGLDDGDDLGAGEAGEKVYRAFDDVFKDYIDAQEDFRFKVEKLAELTEAGNLDLVKFLGELDPDAFRHYYDELAKGGEAGFKDLNNTLALNALATKDTLTNSIPTIGEVLQDSAKFKEVLAAQLGITPEEAELMLQQAADVVAAAGKRISEQFSFTGIFGEDNTGSVDGNAPDHLLGGLLPPAGEMATAGESLTEELFGGVSEGATTFAAPAAADLENAVGTLTEGVSTAAADAVSGVGADVGRLYVTAIGLGVASSTPQVVAVLLDLLSGMGKIAEEGGSEVGEVLGENLIEGSSTSIEYGTAAVAETLLRLFRDVRSNTRGIVADVGELTGQTFALGIIAGVNQGAGAVSTIVAGMFVRAVDVADSLVFNYGRLIGLQFAAGLTAGLSQASRAVLQAAIQLALSVVRTIQEELDINSPSRVAEGIGSFIGEGLAAGLRASTRSVLDAATDLTADIESAFDSSTTLPTFSAQIEEAVQGLSSSLAEVRDVDLTISSDPVRVAQSQVAVALEEVQTPEPVSQSTVISDAQVSVQGGTVATDQEQTRVLLQAILEAIRANPTVIESLVDNYNVYGVEEAQSPQQFAEDVDFIAALVRS